jgi:hypothetical protein
LTIYHEHCFLHRSCDLGLGSALQLRLAPPETPKQVGQRVLPVHSKQRHALKHVAGDDKDNDGDDYGGEKKVEREGGETKQLVRPETYRSSELRCNETGLHALPVCLMGVQIQWRWLLVLQCFPCCCRCGFRSR